MKRAPMSSLRKTSLVAGVFYLLTFVSIPTLGLYSSVRGPNYILGPGPDTPVILGAILEMIVALAGIGTAVTLYPVLRRQNEGLAMGFVGSRVLEAATIYAGIVSLLSVVTLRQAGAGAGALATGQALAAQYYWMFLFGQSFIPAVNAVLLGSLLYQSRLVPRALPVLGFIRSSPACRCLDRHAVRPPGTGVRGIGALCTPDRAVGVLAGHLPRRQRLQALAHHSRHVTQFGSIY